MNMNLNAAMPAGTAGQMPSSRYVLPNFEERTRTATSVRIRTRSSSKTASSSLGCRWTMLRPMT